MKSKSKKQKKKLMNKKFILILIGVVAVVLVCVLGFNLYAGFMFEQQVNNTDGTYVDVSALIIINVNCYENYVDVVIRSAVDVIDTTGTVMTVSDANDNIVGVDDDLGLSTIKFNEFGYLNSTKFLLTPDETYTIKINADGHAQTSGCIAQAGGPQ